MICLCQHKHAQPAIGCAKCAFRPIAPERVAPAIGPLFRGRSYNRKYRSSQLLGLRESKAFRSAQKAIQRLLCIFVQLVDVSEVQSTTEFDRFFPLRKSSIDFEASRAGESTVCHIAIDA
jgi:hypothetical protein